MKSSLLSSMWFTPWKSSFFVQFFVRGAPQSSSLPMKLCASKLEAECLKVLFLINCCKTGPNDQGMINLSCFQELHLKDGFLTNPKIPRFPCSQLSLVSFQLNDFQTSSKTAILRDLRFQQGLILTNCYSKSQLSSPVQEYCHTLISSL